MAGDKFLRLNNTTGNNEEVRGTQVGGGVGQAGDIVALDANGLLDASLMPTGIGADTLVVTAAESITAPSLVNIMNLAGVAMVRNANATDATKPAHGFILASVIMGGSATVYFEGRSTGWTGLTPGATQFLADSNGQRTETPPTTGGNISQPVGVAISSTAIDFERNFGTVIAT